jgi:hypothetical protein
MSAIRHRPAQAEVSAATAHVGREPSGAPRVETNLDPSHRRRAPSWATIAAVILLPMAQAQADSLVLGNRAPNAIATIGSPVSALSARANAAAPQRSTQLPVVAGVRG